MTSENPVCGHCGTMFFPDWKRTDVFYYGNGEGGECIAAAKCPACGGTNARLEKGDFRSEDFGYNRSDWDVDAATIIYPAKRLPVAPEEVPEEISGDYHEAWAVLDASPKAAAALARRCLQAILREQGYTGRDLHKQVDAVLQESETKKALPAVLHSTVDTIRHFGNFSAHPINDLTTLQVIQVEPGEAEFCLRILAELFEHYYVKPKRYLRMVDELNVKLRAAGKPPAKRPGT